MRNRWKWTEGAEKKVFSSEKKVFSSAFALSKDQHEQHTRYAVLIVPRHDVEIAYI
jgi:hypothetical protein